MQLISDRCFLHWFVPHLSTSLDFAIILAD
jgi:hypothetical protein